MKKREDPFWDCNENVKEKLRIMSCELFKIVKCDNICKMIRTMKQLKDFLIPGGEKIPKSYTKVVNSKSSKDCIDKDTQKQVRAEVNNGILMDWEKEQGQSSDGPATKFPPRVATKVFEWHRAVAETDERGVDMDAVIVGLTETDGEMEVSRKSLGKWIDKINRNETNDFYSRKKRG